jgi:hypothetical protein
MKNSKTQLVEDEQAHENQSFGLTTFAPAIKEKFNELLRERLEETCIHNLKRYTCVACTKPDKVSISWEVKNTDNSFEMQ